jgi:hypothetical protein
MRLPQEVEPLGGFLGEADDALGQVDHVGLSKTISHAQVKGARV